MLRIFWIIFKQTTLTKALRQMNENNERKNAKKTHKKRIFRVSGHHNGYMWCNK